MTLLRKQWALKEICGTHLVFRSLNMKCLNMDFFHYILFWSCWSPLAFKLMSHAKFEMFSACFIKYLFFTLFFLSFWDSSDTEVRLTVVFPQLPDDLLLFFFFFSSSYLIICIDLSSNTLVFFCSIHYVLELFSWIFKIILYHFGSEVYIWFSFIHRIYLWEVLSLLVSSTFTHFLAHSHNDYFKVFVWWFQNLCHLGESTWLFFPRKLRLFYIFHILTIIGLHLDILNIVLCLWVLYEL